MYMHFSIYSCCYIHHFLFISHPKVHSCCACAFASCSAAHECLYLLTILQQISPWRQTWPTPSPHSWSNQQWFYIIVWPGSGLEQSTRLSLSPQVWHPLKWLWLCWVKLSLAYSSSGFSFDAEGKRTGYTSQIQIKGNSQAQSHWLPKADFDSSFCHLADIQCGCTVQFLIQKFIFPVLGCPLKIL